MVHPYVLRVERFFFDFTWHKKTKQRSLKRITHGFLANMIDCSSSSQPIAAKIKDFCLSFRKPQKYICFENKQFESSKHVLWPLIILTSYTIAVSFFTPRNPKVLLNYFFTYYCRPHLQVTYSPIFQSACFFSDECTIIFKYTLKMHV